MESSDPSAKPKIVVLWLRDKDTVDVAFYAQKGRYGLSPLEHSAIESMAESEVNLQFIRIRSPTRRSESIPVTVNLRQIPELFDKLSQYVSHPAGITMDCFCLTPSQIPLLETIFEHYQRSLIFTESLHLNYAGPTCSQFLEWILETGTLKKLYIYGPWPSETKDLVCTHFHPGGLVKNLAICHKDIQFNIFFGDLVNLLLMWKATSEPEWMTASFKDNIVFPSELPEFISMHAGRWCTERIYAVSHSKCPNHFLIVVTDCFTEQDNITLCTFRCTCSEPNPVPHDCCS